MSEAMQRSIGAFVKPVNAVTVQDSAAQTINGAAIDRTGFLSCTLFGACGNASGTPTTQTVDVKLQDSADGSTGWTDISGAAIATLVADDTAGGVDVDLSAARQFVRSVVTVGFTGGTTPTVPIAATLVLGGADELPS